MIDGWVHAVPTMQRGEVAKVTMQSEYAYGASGNDVIPPNATLTITIELFDWRREFWKRNRNDVKFKLS